MKSKLPEQNLLQTLEKLQLPQLSGPQSKVGFVFKTHQKQRLKMNFTSGDSTKLLFDKEISISMNGHGRALDNVLIERLWWTVKYEDIYPRNYETGKALYCGRDTYFQYYNYERKHSSLDKKTPAEIFFQQEVKV